MNEAYWIAGGTLPLEDENAYPAVVMQWVGSAGLRPGWINEIQWLSAGGPAPAPSWPGGLAAFTWTPLPLLDHALLHAASHAILSGERDLMLLGSQDDHAAHVLVLASPQAVGRYNLVPHGRLVARLSLPEGEPIDLAGELAAPLKKLEYTPDQIGLLAASGEIKRLGALPTEWKRLAPVPGGAVALCTVLVGEMQRDAVGLGLLASLAPSGPALVSLIEKV